MSTHLNKAKEILAEIEESYGKISYNHYQRLKNNLQVALSKAAEENEMKYNASRIENRKKALDKDRLFCMAAKEVLSSSQLKKVEDAIKEKLDK